MPKVLIVTGDAAESLEVMYPYLCTSAGAWQLTANKVMPYPHKGLNGHRNGHLRFKTVHGMHITKTRFRKDLRKA
jgi:hypothetical protein